MKPGSSEVQALLKRVSRSFYLTLHILPGSVRAPLSVAYLLARATDTVADTGLIAIDRRRELLLQLRENFKEACSGRRTVVAKGVAEARNAVAGSGTEAEQILLDRLQEIVDSLLVFLSEDRSRISKLLDTITTGQENDLEYFGTAAADHIVSFNSDEELERYTYQVAGCVGEFWTQMCRAHVFPKARFDEERLFSDAVRFGKGLQLVNILRDLPQDLRQGRCYIPREQLSRYGLVPRDLLDPSVMERFRPLYETYLKRAEEYLCAGWQYTVSLPFRCVRIRLACAWPILIGMKTIGLLREGNALDAGTRIKLSRSDLRRIILRSTILYPNPNAWTRLIDK